jgi:hypothetical protein
MTETKESLTAERDQLARENEALHRQVDELRAQQQQPTGRRVAAPPSFGLSEGERHDLEVRGTTTSPWTGETLIAEDQGVTPATDEARAGQDRARRTREQG